MYRDGQTHAHEMVELFGYPDDWICKAGRRGNNMMLKVFCYVRGGTKSRILEGGSYEVAFEEVFERRVCVEDLESGGM
jgi:hypothetical protein